MAKVRKNIFVQGLSGSLGKQLVLKRGRNGTIVSKFPVFDENRTFTEPQLKQQNKFGEAVAYAKHAKELEIYIQLFLITTPYFSHMMMEFQELNYGKAMVQAREQL